MSLEVWVAYTLAAIVILIIPGPTILLVVGQALTHGRKSVIPLVTGVILGDFTAMTLSFFGLGVILSTSATLFTVLKWIGAAYLIYLGINLWRSKPENDQSPETEDKVAGKVLLKRSYIVTALNPKGIAFFTAFMPQFISSHQPAVTQFIILGGTFLILAGINGTLYAIFAGRVRVYMKRSSTKKWFDRCGGGALIGAGLVTAAMEQS